MKNQFDEKSDGQLNGQLIESFQEEFRPKSHFEEWLPVYRAGGLLRLLLQAVSLTMAVTLLAYPAKYFFDSWIFGIPPAVLLLIFLEVVKRRSADVGFRRLFTEGKVPGFVLAVALLASGASVVSSVFGTPLFVAEIAPAPVLIDTASIKTAANGQKEAATAFWSPQIEKAEGDAKATFKEGNWKGKISGRTKDQKYSHEKRASGFQDSLNSALAKIDGDLAAGLSGAIGANQLTTDGAAAQTANVGFWTAVACGLLELLFFALSFFLVRFKFISSLQLAENNQEADLPVGPNPTPTPGKKKKTERKETVSDLERLQEMFPHIAERFGNALNETETAAETEQETRPETRNETGTKQEQPTGNIDWTEGSKDNRSEAETKQETKMTIINKDVNHGTATIRNKKKVIYYVTNKGKSNENIKYYNKSEVEKMVKLYERRLADARTTKNLKSVRTNAERLAEWKRYRVKLHGYQPTFA
jgi:hypothetical protein